jgi:hypothetical protein
MKRNYCTAEIRFWRDKGERAPLRAIFVEIDGRWWRSTTIPIGPRAIANCTSGSGRRKGRGAGAFPHEGAQLNPPAAPDA